METSPALQLRVCCRIKLRGDWEGSSDILRKKNKSVAGGCPTTGLPTKRPNHTSCGPTFFFAWHLETIAERRRVRRSSGSS